MALLIGYTVTHALASCATSLASQCLVLSVFHSLASYGIGFPAKRNGGTVSLAPELTRNALCQCAALSVTHTLSKYRVIDNPYANDMPLYRQLAR